MHFGEYELSPSLISLSPLPSSHPEAFQRLLVRSSIRCYPDFNLLKVDHLVSRLPLPTIRPVQTRFRFGYRPHDP